ncbi:Uncharacterised protein [Campylobacter hyointestinalis subsp. hyointestinalis]|uniref:Uncharacterized protein n=1 Tax=Campylobacter hyointestinalis subsp. hyointestinalis TaxID=91352 RepID=A0A0S4SVI9_CAMHY|nr:Uncharacterised protein [Campylobacter hyointestinalis subsp. hyointestinalis]
MNTELEQTKGLVHGLIIPIWIYIFSTGFLAIYWLCFVNGLYLLNTVGSTISKHVFIKSTIYTWSFFIIWTTLFE